MARKAIDLTNQRFSRLVAIKKVNTKGNSKWLCQCDCGNTKEVDAYNLLSGNTKSCGCRKRNHKDITNQRFGKLVAIRRVNAPGKPKWLCQCDCGNIKEVRKDSLVSGAIRSCGCLLTKDLTNRRFGKLVALKRVNTTGQARWECQCDCGNKNSVLANNLLTGRTKSCGCLRDPQDLTNQRFSKLVVIKRVNTTGKARWLCQCDCGNTKVIAASALLGGETKSCGCLQKSKTKDLTNQRIGKWTVLKLVNTNPAKWECRCDCGTVRVVTAKVLLSGKSKSCGECYRDILLGQRFNRLLVLKVATKRSGSNYLYECQCDCGNIAYATASQLKSGRTKSCGCYIRDFSKENIKYVHQKSKELYIDGAYPPALTSKPSSKNTSGYVGVHYGKRKDRWIATIALKRKIYYLGSYRNKEDAIKARRRGEEELFEPILEKFAELQKKE